ncbi:MAG: hypothetical protein K2W91_12525 [Novosphingobium sp.]|nr:hypothetical protein [Novosphingobium sp.]
MKYAVGLVCSLLALAALGTEAQATTWMQTKIKCPIGGKSFNANEMASNSYFGQRPDGRPYSPSPIPPIQECPDNGFVIFDEKFSKDELAKLTSLVSSPEYQAMRTSESQHYRAWWLMKQVGRNPYSLAMRLMIASWEVDELPATKIRYQKAFVAAVMALEVDGSRRQDWFWLRLRAANALRELGRFAESDKLIDATMAPENLPEEADQKEGAVQLATGLKALNHDRNAKAEPANLVPARMAIELCKEAGLSAAEQVACDGPEVKEAREELRKWRSPDEASSDAAKDAAEAAQEAARKVE